MGEDRDEDITRWKNTVASQLQSTSLLEPLHANKVEEDAVKAKADLDISGNSTISSADLQASGFSFTAFEVPSPSQGTDEEEDVYQALGVQPLMADEPTPTPSSNTKSALTDSMMQIPGCNEDTYKQAAHAIASAQTHDRQQDVVREAIKINKSKPVSTYQFIFDNLDFTVTAKHQSKQNKNRSIHWVNTGGLKDRVTTALPDDGPQKPLSEFQISDFFVSEETQGQLRRDYIILVSRVMEKYLGALRGTINTKGTAVRHIPHQYSEEMSQPSEQTWLGLQFKNENLSRDMVDILRFYQENYVPAELDEEGHITKLLQTDGNTPLGRLESLLAKFELWHSTVNLTDKWTPATVIQQTEQPRSWLVETPDGVQYRRNRKHLQKIKESSVDTSDESAVDESPTPVLNDTAAQPYITRSGRAVKPPVKLDLILQKVATMWGAHGTKFWPRWEFVLRTGPIYMDDLRCDGNETSLFSCSYAGWTIHDCDHGQDAGVVCHTDFSRIRLVGGSGPNEGRVEVRPADSSRWGTVCHNGFDLKDAEVVCRMLGYPNVYGVRFNAYFGRGTGPIYIEDLQCDGTESSLFNCSHKGWRVHDCRPWHHEDVGVVCAKIRDRDVTRRELTPRITAHHVIA
ncbi:hypothetical protein Bbelb_253390 [Branchiostoma belcheri]|nr:hypothetical protein Bbelb_253390 [Branchiostoma belcheri]